MKRDTTPNFVPRLDQYEGLWQVKMKTGPGQYDILSDLFASKRTASRHLRRIRKEMAKAWLASHVRP
ncbi:hypothetical protein [Mesorhizobium sp.]|uniref:hypothetical protein n=1 Tax=Mesorhizobium sp. TaxID=1871066 RepID=UPI0012179128|nr:hypothetical protein [Mesorhizobium sp.]TIS37525.1 MAG: hypothetical protein E5W95_18100 [Mesorhizobium sp.]